VSKVKVNGLETVIKSFGKDADKIRKRAEQIVTTNALEGRNEAIKLAPIAFGKLRQGIAVEKISPLEQSVVSQMDYSPFVEFGTGGKVSVPAEWQSVAMQFKGKRMDFAKQLNQIKEWCRLKGIDQKFAYPILISIIEDGLEAQPFMYPAWKKTQKQFSNDMIKLVNESR
jgi:HK97 gp10 family phage protein